MRHGTVKRVPEQLGYGPESVRSWLRQADLDDHHASRVTSAGRARICEL